MFMKLTSQGESVHVVDEVDEAQYPDSHVFQEGDFTQTISSSALLLLQQRGRRLIVTVYNKLLVRCVRGYTTLFHVFNSTDVHFT